MRVLIAAVLLLILVSSVYGLEKKDYMMREDFGSAPLYDCYLSYFYYIPCPSTSWFWGVSGWEPGDIIGVFFKIGDVSTFSNKACDPLACFMLEQIRIMDFAGYGTIYPGYFSVTFDVYCADEHGCPVGPPLWTSAPKATGFAWNYIQVDPPLCLDDCAVDPGPPPGGPRILVTATHTGSMGLYPAWGFDNISTPVAEQCELHDYCCMDALYPRPYNSHYAQMHTGYYGNGSFQYCPPMWFADGADSTPDATVFGFIEAAWRIYLICQGPTASEPSTWGNIKSMYR